MSELILTSQNETALQIEKLQKETTKQIEMQGAETAISLKKIDLQLIEFRNDLKLQKESTALDIKDLKFEIRVSQVLLSVLTIVSTVPIFKMFLEKPEKSP